jgi:hypothetical protein
MPIFPVISERQVGGYESRPAKVTRTQGQGSSLASLGISLGEQAGVAGCHTVMAQVERQGPRL